MKNWVCYIFQKCSGIILNARTSVWVNQKGYTTLFLNQHVNVKETKYDIYPRSTQALHRMPGLLPGWTRKDTQHFPILTMNEKLSMLYIPEALRHLMLNARTSAWINQKGYTTFPYINHYIYPKSTQALCWMPGLQPGWTRKDTQHFSLLTKNEKQ